VFVLALGFVQGQTLTTYYCGFDSPAERTGWTQFRKSGLAGTGWSLEQNAYTTPTCLAHYYPVGSSAPTNDWYVSPAFNLGAGGKIDSVRFNFSGFGTPGTSDTICIKLLSGSNNPGQATKITKLIEFTGADYVNDGAWRVKTNITIPPSAGNSYIAFQYYTTNSNWLDVKFDNLKLKLNSTVGLTAHTHAARSARLYYTSAGRCIFVEQKEVSESKNLLLQLYNLLGEKVLQRQLEVNTTEPVDLSTGLYVYVLTSANGKVAGQGKLLIENNL